jgi:catechol 2,3-dioxygenase-like lactoylglutathione lyase family enzyme
MSTSTPPLALDHVALPMFDPEATRAFYRDVLGFTLVDALSGDDWGGRGWLMLIFADAFKHQLALCAFDGPRTALDADWPADTRHYAFSAGDRKALSGWKARLDERGVAWREEDHGAQQSIYFSDPNGTVLEITTALPAGKPQPSTDADATLDAWLKAKATRH